MSRQEPAIIAGTIHKAIWNHSLFSTDAKRLMQSDNYLRLENRRTGEILAMRRKRDAQGQFVLILDGDLPPGTSGPPLHEPFSTMKAASLKSLY
jgi:hypothetical protein